RDPKRDDDDTAIAPLGGDFNISGGLYRHVALISTPEPVHIALDDLGGPGIYARTASIDGGNASVEVRSKLTSGASEAGEVVVRASLVDADGTAAQTAEETVTLQPGGREEVTQTLEV